MSVNVSVSMFQRFSLFLHLLFIEFTAFILFLIPLYLSSKPASSLSFIFNSVSDNPTATHRKFVCGAIHNAACIMASIQSGLRTYVTTERFMANGGHFHKHSYRSCYSHHNSSKCLIFFWLTVTTSERIGSQKIIHQKSKFSRNRKLKIFNNSRIGSKLKGGGRSEKEVGKTAPLHWQQTAAWPFFLLTLVESSAANNVFCCNAYERTFWKGIYKIESNEADNIMTSLLNVELTE